MALFWLSFCLGDRPKGEQFAGVTLVDTDVADDAGEAELREALKTAIKHAWAVGANPGGQVASTLITDAGLARMSNRERVRLARAPRDTLMSKEELQHYDLI